MRGKYLAGGWRVEGDHRPEAGEGLFAVGRALQQRYHGRIEIGLGVEVGYNPERVEETVAFLRRYPWDRIGLSCHFLRHERRHLNPLSRKEENMAEFSCLGVARIISAYLEGLMMAGGNCRQRSSVTSMPCFAITLKSTSTGAIGNR